MSELFIEPGIPMAFIVTIGVVIAIAIVACIVIAIMQDKEMEARQKRKDNPKPIGLTTQEMLDMERNYLLGQINTHLNWQAWDHFTFHHFNH